MKPPVSVAAPPNVWPYCTVSAVALGINRNATTAAPRRMAQALRNSPPPHRTHGFQRYLWIRAVGGSPPSRRIRARAGVDDSGMASPDLRRPNRRPRRRHLVLNHLELVPVRIREPEDRAPLFLLRRAPDLDALLALSRLLLGRVRVVEKVSRVPLLPPGGRAEYQPHLTPPTAGGHRNRQLRN